MPTSASIAAHLRRWPARFLVVACLVGGMLATAHADDYSEVNRLIQAGRLDAAQQRAQRHLQTKPRDPQMRFLQGVIHSEAGRQDLAEAVFTALTQDYPELPEPYNNLAVILAAKGQWEPARQALETAIRLDAAYATAHENLGDVYAQLAARAYGQARQLDRSRAAPERKLTLIRQLLALNTPVRLSPQAGDTSPSTPRSQGTP